MRLFLLALGLALVSSPVWSAAAPKVEIRIQGVSDEMLATVQQSLALFQQRNDPLLTDATIRRLHRRADRQIRRALRPFGYYRARVDSTLTRTADGWHAVYRIRPGEPVPLVRVDIAITGPGADLPAFQQWQRAYPFKPGDALRHAPYEREKKRLLGLARDHGFFDASLIEHRIFVDLDAYQATIKMRFDTGPRYRFGEIAFDQRTFNEEFLRRFLAFKPGEPYQAAKLLALQRALVDADYFQRVTVEPRPDEGRDNEVPVVVKLVPRKRTRYSLGVGFSTDTGPRLTLGIDRRYVNRRGHRMGVELKPSLVSSSLDAFYRIPLRRPSTDYLSLNADVIDEDTDTAESRTTAVSLNHVRVLGNWQRTVGVSYEREDFEIAGDSGRSRLLVPHLGFERTKTDDRIHTRQGWRLRTQVRGAAKALLSDASFVQWRVSGKYIHSLGNDDRLLLRGDLGTSWVAEFDELPPSQRFFAGGDQSIRGYDFESLGPTDDRGRVRGGRHLLVGSVEYEHRLNPKWGVAVFLDAGNAFNMGEFDVKQGAGIGVRWRLPIGTVRADVASAISEPGNPLRFHLTIGPDL